MSKTKGCLLRLCIFAVVAVAMVWFGAWILADQLAPRILNRVIPQVAAQAKAKGVVLKDLAFSKVKVSPFFNEVTVEGIEAKFDLRPDDRISVQSSVEVGSVEVTLTSLIQMRGTVAAHGIEVRFDPSDLPASLPYGHLFDAEVVVKDLPLTQPRLAVEEIRSGLMELFTEGSVEGDATFVGRVRMVVDGAEAVAMIFTEHSEGRFRLRCEEGAIRSLADQLELDLADEQVEIVSKYPLRIPFIMEITDRARDVARREGRGDVWLEDAMRHVFWSFLLTEEFGPEFARVVTDAQEMRPGNSPDERTMDFHNNAMGRKLSAEGVAFGALPDRVRTDPGIIRDPDEVALFKGRLLK